MHQIEVGEAARQQAARPQTEGERLGKPGRAHKGKLDDVGQGGELAQLRDPEGVWLPVQVQARNLDELDRVLELGVGRPGKNRHRVAERR